MESGIYRILDTRNNKCYYGSSKNIKVRWKRHLNDLKNGNHNNTILQRIWDKYGNVFKFEVVEFCNEDILLEVEQRYIDKNIDGYNICLNSYGGDNISNNPNREIIIEKIKNSVRKRISDMSEEERKIKYGKNGSDNPNYGNRWTEDMKKKLSNKKKGLTPINKGLTNKELLGNDKANDISNKLSEYAKLRVGDKNPFYGKKHTEEVKHHLSEVRKKQGYKGNQNIEFEIDGVKYKSLSEASKDLNIPKTTIRWRIKSKNKKYKNYKYI